MLAALHMELLDVTTDLERTLFAWGGGTDAENDHQPCFPRKMLDTGDRSLILSPR